jgi:hypothetical protein
VSTRTPSPGIPAPSTYRGEDGAGPTRHGTIRQLLDEDGTAVVAFHGGGETAVSAHALERKAA